MLNALVMQDFNYFLLADDVIVTGLLTAKWSPELKDVRCDLDPVLIANNVRCKKSSYCVYLKIITKIIKSPIIDCKQFQNFYFLIVRRINELKSEIDISDDIVKKFEQFWACFKDSPLKGGILNSDNTLWYCLYDLN